MNKILTEGIIIAGASAYVYLVTFLYEYGYCSHFEIPSTLINPSLATVLVASATVGGLFLSSLKMLGLSVPLFRAAIDPGKNPYREFYALNGIFIFGGILFFNIYMPSFKTMAIVVAVILVMELLWFFPVIFFQRKIKLSERFDAYAQTQDKTDFVVLLMDWFGHERIAPMIILCLILFMAFHVGRGEASRKGRFLTLKTSPDVIVLRNYGDLFIAARFDRDRKTVSDNMLLIHINDSSDYEFRNEIVGPLTLFKEKVDKKEEAQSNKDPDEEKTYKITLKDPQANASNEIPAKPIDTQPRP